MKTFEVMKAKEYGERFVKDWRKYRIEPKFDGIRVISLVVSDEVKFFSRNGRELTMFGHLHEDMRRLANKLARKNTEYAKHGAMFDGEMCGSTFNEIGGAIHRKDHTEDTAEYYVFHSMPKSRFDKGGDDLPQSFRRVGLEKSVYSAALLGVYLVNSIQVTSHKDCQYLFKAMMKDGYEGAMLKNMDEPWVAKRNRSWMKLKASDTEDLRIVGWKPGKGKFNGTVGAIIVERKHKGKKVEVSVSGMDDDMRHHLFQMQDALGTGKHIAEIEFQHVTEKGSLRHPRFVKLRRDKEK